ncbi:unnamed protein product [Ixodes hexagonus]
MDSNLVLGLHQGMGCSSMDGSDVRGLHSTSATSHMGNSRF